MKEKEIIKTENKVNVIINSIIPNLSELIKRAEKGEDPNKLLKEIEPKFTIKQLNN